MTATDHNAVVPPATPPRLIDMKAVLRATGFASRASIYTRIPHDFPAPIRLSRRCSRWLESDVHAWITAQAAKRDAS